MAPESADAASRQRSDLEALARRWVTLWDGDLSAFDELHADNFIDHSPAGRGTDRAAFRQGIVELRRVFPDLRTTVEDVIVDAERGRLAVRWSALGTHVARFLDRGPTGRRIRFQGIEILSVVGGRIAERWGEWDGLGLLDQLGVWRQPVTVS